jgi:hypothetical protein
MKTDWGGGGIASRILNLRGVRDISAHWKGGGVGPRFGMEAVREEKIPITAPAGSRIPVSSP